MFVFLAMPTVMELLGGGGVTSAEIRRLIGISALDAMGYFLLGIVVLVIASLCMLTRASALPSSSIDEGRADLENPVCTTAHRGSQTRLKSAIVIGRRHAHAGDDRWRAVVARGRYLAAAVAIVLFAFVGGFVIFASSIAHYAPAAGLQADGIVVLTGGEHRLSEAARLLAEGRGKRLLISGANRQATRQDLYRKSGLSTKLFERVDVGYAAHDTSGNAEETGLGPAPPLLRLIIVTSSYHMPRSLIELGRAMPATALVPYPVVSGNFRTERWWMHAPRPDCCSPSI